MPKLDDATPLPIDLYSVKNQYQAILTLASTRGFRKFSKILDLNLFFQQAERWGRGNKVLRQRINQATFDRSLCYVKSLLDQINEVLLPEATSVSDKYEAIKRILNNKETLKQGVAIVAALDKNTPALKTFKRHLGFGLFTMLIGIILTPIFLVLTISYGLLFGLPKVLLRPFFQNTKFFKMFNTASSELFKFIRLLMEPLIASVIHLRTVSVYSRNRQGLSLGLVKAFRPLFFISHRELDSLLGGHRKTNQPPKIPDQSLAAGRTYDAKIEKAQLKMDAFEAEKNNLALGQADDYSRFVNEGHSYYSERVHVLAGMKSFEIDHGLALTPAEFREKRCDLDEVEKSFYLALKKPSKINLLEAQLALASPDEARHLPAVNNNNLTPRMNSLDGPAKQTAYYRGRPRAHGLFMFEHCSNYHQEHAEKVKKSALSRA